MPNARGYTEGVWHQTDFMRRTLEREAVEVQAVLDDLSDLHKAVVQTARAA